MIITIDGPTASGKTTIARLLAQKLGYYYLSSGLLFRGLAYCLVHDFLYTHEQMNNPRENDIISILNPSLFCYSYDPEKGEQLIVGGKNITHELRGQALSQYSSIIATNPVVRQKLADYQYTVAQAHNVVAEGRDMGSAIFPHASIKFFLTASLGVRASRWQHDQKKKGNDITFEQACSEIAIRDERDASRAMAPLCIPDGAIIIDDSHLTEQNVLEKMIEVIAKD